MKRLLLLAQAVALLGIGRSYAADLTFTEAGDPVQTLKSLLQASETRFIPASRAVDVDRTKPADVQNLESVLRAIDMGQTPSDDALARAKETAEQLRIPFEINKLQHGLRKEAQKRADEMVKQQVLEGTLQRVGQMAQAEFKLKTVGFDKSSVKAGDLPQDEMNWLDAQVAAILENKRISKADLARAKAINARMSSVEAILGAVEAYKASLAAQYEERYPSASRSPQINERINQIITQRAQPFADHRAAVVAVHKHVLSKAQTK